ncbi:hypothetical protein CERZMDRAFT_93109 [Cercospora zeae-maydis SCOH1-5]|uniref:Glutamate-1-semialdehyde 2,1-aminomutase n=1 Tax=Cercospora zeae-maydis SCOH1-5 TaxID=717836 RepID=A0A6A6FU76_9PEZI|nr:hypothetical protein CERZMDRAFT_93109 [Cercospora zeae-maydis SCOH1-5]
MVEFYCLRVVRRVKINAPHEYLIATYNDIASVKNLVDANVRDLAAILLEPMIGFGVAVPADRDFLVQLRKIAAAAGAVLIYDEVMTSRMYSGGGIQSDFPTEHRPDMTALGKDIGGGMSFGAFGGKREIMKNIRSPETGRSCAGGDIQ